MSRRKSSGTLSTDSPKPHPDIIEIDNERSALGIPIEDLCSVAGIRTRTYRYWRAGAKQPYGRNRAAVRRALKAIRKEMEE